MKKSERLSICLIVEKMNSSLYPTTPKEEMVGFFSSFFLPLFLSSIIIMAMVVPMGEAWGKEGHFMVCKIAEQYLTEKTYDAVVELLPEEANGELAAVCSWGDEVRFRYRWSTPLHFVDTPDCTYKYSRDCHNSKGVKGMCVVGAINNYTEQLRSYGNSSSSYNLTESLMFLAHFVGDVHQPLHVSFAKDEGGNTIIVHWYRRKTNLHHVWDVSIIETAMKDFYNNDLSTMMEAIRANITNNWSDQVDNWKICGNKRATCANDYALESLHYACNYAYKDVEQDATLGDDYFYSRLPVVEKRIAQGGVRLGSILNRIFDTSAVAAI